ncbi:Serine/threonine-protein kinase KIC1 [Candida viswanathii]|uniref:non-specific serine/threonine protein kinase n=1 Tax=Candida viswanathii TaxID=5486 RepID=A0A367XP76_9ASCO|nr:Serine/threonine-protein kinase KIC1 [Candida viswanathii]
MNSTSIYKRTEVIGRGKFGVVYKAYNKQSKQVVAIKVLNLDTDEDELIDVQQEIQFLTELKNVPNITHYYGSILNDTKLWIIMDYCAGGSLRTLLKAGVLEERYIAIVVRELLFTLSAVHKLGVIHRDLKAANILISKEGNVQLCDFGVAAKLTSNSSKRTTMAGTPYWMAPEVIRTGDSYNSKADIWSLGITIYEIATGNPPYCDKDASWAMQLISKQTPPRLEGREYSLALKECIALCLDENPDERPSADDMMKCKLMKTYKNYPTAILKEVISRYLLWRDRNASRDSVFINLEDEQEDSVDALVDKSLHGGYQDSLNHQIQVKWDFDSLSSREYIMENDIDLDNVDQQYNNDYDTAQNNGDYNNYSTLPTLKAPTTFGRNQSTLAMNGNNNNSNTNLKTMNTSKPSTEVPKSLQMLFEDSTEDNEPLTAPTIPNINERMESPTIEIPDMDSLSQLPTSTANSSLSSTANSSHPPLNKPPTLYHSQSASGSLESRFSSQNTSPNEGTGRPRKKTISNTMGANLSIPLQQAVAAAAPHTPPYSTASVVRTPSPNVPGTAGLAGAINVSKTGSPSKMKALQSNSNPLLQPINMKLETNITGANNASTTSHPPVQAPPQLLNQQSMPNIPTTSSLSQQVGNLKGKRSKPGFIQMPTPSNALSNLSALTNEPQDNENVNQFGINPAQAAAMQISMTPVTEKEPPQFFPTINDESKEATPAAPVQSRSHHNSLLSHKKSAANSSTHNLSTLAASSSSGAAPSSNVMLTRGNSVNVPLSLNINGASANSAHNIGNFPTIPSINGELFLDSVNKQKLVNELDVMIKLFNQGLEVLEENL